MTKESASIRISAAIREDIFRGQLLSGTSLIETELTEKTKFRAIHCAKPSNCYTCKA